MRALRQPCVMCGRYDRFVVCSYCAKDLNAKDRRCLGCGAAIARIHLNYCGKCLQQPLIFNKVYVLYDYQDWIRKLIFEFKYKQNLAVGKFFAYKLYNFYQTIDNYDVIIPVPLHKNRLAKRGFHHVLELTRLMKKDTQVDNKVIVRIKDTKEFNELSLQQRQKEVRKAFVVAKTMDYKSILIVDDIMTTTTTITEISKIINKHYKNNNKQQPKIDILALARA